MCLFVNLSFFSTWARERDSPRSRALKKKSVLAWDDGSLQRKGKNLMFALPKHLVPISRAKFVVLSAHLCSSLQGILPYTAYFKYHPSMEKLHSKHHEFLVCWIVSIVIVLNVQQKRLYLNYWYK